MPKSPVATKASRSPTSLKKGGNVKEEGAAAAELALKAHVLHWSDLSNGDLLLAAEKQFDVLIDRQLRHQQNLAARKIAVLVLPFASWPKLRPQVADIAAAVDALSSGEYIEFPPRG